MLSMLSIPLALLLSATIRPCSAIVDEISFAVSAETDDYGSLIFSQDLFTNQAFGNSWNQPANVQYSPPVNPATFNRVILELTVNSTGANYDRLGQLFVNDIEIWRTSTAEPDDGGMSWSVEKDVSHYASLFKDNGTVSLLLQNRVTSKFTGSFVVSLVAKFYYSSGTPSRSDDGWAVSSDNLPDKIEPLSKQANTPSVSWSAPSDDISHTVTLDKSVNRALLHIFASGNGDDEFWWDNAHTGGANPSRFIDVYVGDQLAGFVAPYPVIFTGGISAYLWKPLTGLRTLDVPAYFIDISPFLPALWGGAPISLKLTNGVDSTKTPDNWIINYNLFTWSSSGQENSGSTDTPDFSHQTTGENSNDPLYITRKLTTSANLNLGGKKQEIKWTQSVSFNSTVTGNTSGKVSHVWQETEGSSALSGPSSYNISYNWPLQCEMDNGYIRVQQTYDVDAGNQTYSSWVDSSVNLAADGSLDSAASSQYVDTPGGSHYAKTQNLNVVVQW